MKRLRRLFLLLPTILLILTSAAAQSITLTAYDVRWSPDGALLGVGSSDGVWLYDARGYSAEPVHLLPGRTVYTLAFDPARPHVALASEIDYTGDARLQVFNVDTAEEIFSVPVPPTPYTFSVSYDVTYTADSTRLTVTNGINAYELDAENGTVLRQFTNTSATSEIDNWLTSLAYDDKNHLYLTDWGGNLYRWLPDAQSPSRFALGTPIGAQQTLLVPPGPTPYVLAGSILYMYDTRTRRLAQMTDPAEMEIYGAALSPDGRWLAMGSDERWVMYDMVAQDFTLDITTEMRPDDTLRRVFALAFSPDGARLATLQTDGQIIIWDAETGEQIVVVVAFESGLSRYWG
jgi:WD40 repeat protein